MTANTVGPVETWRRTKIVATLGPACDDPKVLREMLSAGVDVVRLNMSHGTLDGHYERIDRVRDIANSLNKTIAILADLCGPKIRLGQFGEEQVHLHEGDPFTLTTQEVIGDSTRATCQYENLTQDVEPGQIIHLADGLIQLKVLEVDKQDVRCEVLNPGVLTSGKGVNLPGTYLSTPSLTPKDEEDLQGILKKDIDFVALSFVRSPEDIRTLKKRIAESGREARVVAKIEKPEAVTFLAAILEETDAIMVARGDLGVETSVEGMPILQKQIISMANRAGKPAITATQMLETMTYNPRPTRAEASDVANAILDGTDAVMLSGETAAGQYPVQAVKTMARIAEVIEPQLHRLRDRRVPLSQASGEREAIASAATHSAAKVGARVICAFTKSGSSAVAISQCRPEVPVIALTPDEKMARRLKLSWGVYPFLCPHVTHFEQMVSEVRSALVEKVNLRKGDLVCLVAGLPLGSSFHTNTLHIKRLLETGFEPT
jgi:pyruvate kinase